jgi:hypothetical protein
MESIFTNRAKQQGFTIHTASTHMKTKNVMDKLIYVWLEWIGTGAYNYANILIVPQWYDVLLILLKHL